MLSDSLTRETLRKLFKNNFDLCNFAINIGRNVVLSNSQASLSDVLVEIETRAAATPSS